MLKETPPDDYAKYRRLYQYEFKNQMAWFKHKSIIDSHLMHVYPVIESLIQKLFISTRDSSMGRGRTSSSETTSSTDSPSQPVMPAQSQMSALDKLKDALGRKQTIEEELLFHPTNPPT